LLPPAWELRRHGMKNLLILIFCAPLCLSAQYKELPADQMPESVKSSFSKNFPGATIGSWEQEEYGLYEIEFRWEGRDASATFNANGLLQRTEEVVPESEMPAEVTAHAQKMFPSLGITECQLISTPDKKKLYEVEMTGGQDRKSLIFDENNNFLRVEVDEDDDDPEKEKPGKKG
jgi:hypothetical protein